jgi:uncharacterized protein
LWDSAMIDPKLLGKGFHLLAKPRGPLCNLDCGYCFYSEKKVLFPESHDFRMSDKVLEAYVSKYVSSQVVPEVQFVWQGGEPTLTGLEFFKKAVEIQKRYAGTKKISNFLQTNGTLLDDTWCKFLKANGFLVGISMDGPAWIHDRYRVDRAGKPTFQRVLKGLHLLQKYRVPFNVLLCVTEESSKHPLEVYRFLKETGVRFVQFTPIVERIPDRGATEVGLKHAGPPPAHCGEVSSKVSPWTVTPEGYGSFLTEIFEEWVHKDVGSIHVMNFEWALGSWMGLPSTVCIFAKQCGKALTMEHNGDIYSCDHYVYPQYRVGNIVTDGLPEILESVQQGAFGLNKETSLPRVCTECEVGFACNGGCPKHRFIESYQAEQGLNYLCAGYKTYFRHIHRYMKVMVQLIENGLPAARVMDVVKAPLVIAR